MIRLCVLLLSLSGVLCEVPTEHAFSCEGMVCPTGTKCVVVSSGCDDVPEGAECLPVVEAKCVPDCPNTPCAIRCRYGLAYDDKGCQLCQCLPSPCGLVLCLVGTTCEAVLDDTCNSVGCKPYKAVCKPICPNEPCALKCQYGLAHDGKGCMLCECLPDPCTAAQCLTGSTCKAVPNDECKDVGCQPFKPVCSLVCKPQMCKLFCEFGFKTNSNGCEICSCKPDPCLNVKCQADHVCKVKQTSNCKKAPCPYVGHCVYNCPLVKCRPCVSGFVVDANGCNTCQCKDPCENVVCPSGQTCAPYSSLEERYTCATASDLCCPVPKPPRNCLSSQNVCQTCFKDCSTMRCGGQSRCCPDYFGCYGCRAAVPCLSEFIF